MDRRTFLKFSGASALLVLPIGTFLVSCKDDGENGPNEADPTPPDAAPRSMGSNVVFTSNLAQGHAHSFTVPSADLQTPPTGGDFGFTTQAKNHSHKVEITEEALRKASQGEIAKIVTSKDMDHTHTFTILKV